MLATHEITRIIHRQAIREIMVDEPEVEICRGCGELDCTCSMEEKAELSNMLKEQAEIERWRKMYFSSLCCENASPYPGGCVGSLCFICPDHGENHRGSHE